jgi:murein DD-endopeptidase MepM/ murein hydrolase activator NlpD
MSKVLVKNGQGVTRGQIVGLMGSTGYSTGSHVHYEVYRNGKVLNPRDFMLNQQ